MKPSVARKALRASPAAEARYVSDLRRIVRGVHGGTEQAVLSHWSHKNARADAMSIAPIELVLRALGPHVAKTVGAAFDRMSDKVATKNAAGAKMLGLTPRALNVEGTVSRARAENIALIHTATLDYADQVKAILEDEANFGLRVEELKKLLEERAGVGESRAELIARDQTLKLNGAITKERHTRAGVERFTWSTSNDERVRESHAELDGQAFSWDDLPEVDGEEAYPGSPIQCRCIPVPLVGEEEESSETGPESGDQPALAGVDLGAMFKSVLEEREGQAAEIVSAMPHAGVAEWLEGEDRPALEIKASGPAGVNGDYRNDGRIRVFSKRAADAAEASAGRSAVPWGEAWSVSSRGGSATERMQRTYMHELGHHLHMWPASPFNPGRSAVGARVARIVEDAWAAVEARAGGSRGRRAIYNGAAASPNPAITRYALKDQFEYFAENFSAYLNDREALEKHDPHGLAMVKAVLRELGIER